MTFYSLVPGTVVVTCLGCGKVFDLTVYEDASQTILGLLMFLNWHKRYGGWYCPDCAPKEGEK